MEPPPRRTVPNATSGLVLILLVATAHAGGPTLAAAPHQQRTRAADAGIVPLWDTSWWITLSATRGDAPLARIEYSARFSDTADPRPLAGGIDVADADRDGVSGRIVVTCPTRPDYEKKLRVKVRASDATGATSEWADLDFPLRANLHDPVIERIPASIAPTAEHHTEVVGVVEIEAGDGMTIGDIKAALQHKAQSQGGDAAVNFRMVTTTAETSTFAADAVHDVRVVPAPPIVATPVPPSSDRVLGEIAMPAARR